jgi:hypothetical protein
LKVSGPPTGPSIVVPSPGPSTVGLIDLLSCRR